MPDPRERLNDPEEALRAALDGLQAKLRTAMPGIIQSFNTTTMTCVIQPAIQAKVRTPDGTLNDVSLPLLLDCPVQFAGGGGFSGTFPIAKGDECLVILSDRCIDAWWQLSGVQVQAELRMHDLSDGFCIPGIRSKPRVISNISTNSAQLRSDDGSSFFEVGVGFLKLKSDNIYIEGVSKVNIGASGAGRQFTPTGENTFLDGTSGSHSAPTPPKIPE